MEGGRVLPCRQLITQAGTHSKTQDKIGGSFTICM